MWATREVNPVTLRRCVRAMGPPVWPDPEEAGHVDLGHHGPSTVGGGREPRLQVEGEGTCEEHHRRMQEAPSKAGSGDDDVFSQFAWSKKRTEVGGVGQASAQQTHRCVCSRRDLPAGRGGPSELAKWEAEEKAHNMPRTHVNEGAIAGKPVALVAGGQAAHKSATWK